MYKERPQGRKAAMGAVCAKTIWRMPQALSHPNRSRGGIARKFYKNF